ncbi:hypothetical protein FAIPA1_90107 [Frankia sp. AiPs1]
MVHRLVDARPSGDEPEVDRAQWAQHPAGQPRLLAYLADRGLLDRLTGLDVPLRQRPEHPTGPVAPADQRRVGIRGTLVEDEAARGGLLYPAQPGMAGGGARRRHAFDRTRLPPSSRAVCPERPASGAGEAWNGGGILVAQVVEKEAADAAGAVPRRRGRVGGADGHPSSPGASVRHRPWPGSPRPNP